MRRRGKPVNEPIELRIRETLERARVALEVLRRADHAADVGQLEAQHLLIWTPIEIRVGYNDEGWRSFGKESSGKDIILRGRRGGLYGSSSDVLDADRLAWASPKRVSGAPLSEALISAVVNPALNIADGVIACAERAKARAHGPSIVCVVHEAIEGYRRLYKRLLSHMPPVGETPESPPVETPDTPFDEWVKDGLRRVVDHRDGYKAAEAVAASSQSRTRVVAPDLFDATRAVSDDDFAERVKTGRKSRKLSAVERHVYDAVKHRPGQCRTKEKRPS
ncbi:MAG: hypothetical protein ACRENE_07100 [Polyangiaceae bacterium]